MGVDVIFVGIFFRSVCFFAIELTALYYKQIFLKVYIMDIL